jgi:hypothetical protein
VIKWETCSADEYKQREFNTTKRITIKEDGYQLEVHSTLTGYPIRFEVTEELRNFLRSL